MSLLDQSLSYAKIAWGYTRRVIAPFFFGITLNWLFAFIFLIGWISTMTATNSLPAILLMAAFFVGFPFLYFWLARGYALRKGLELVYKGSEDVISKVLNVVVSASVNSSTALENSGLFIKSKGKKNGGIKGAINFIKQIEDKLPRPMRRILKFLLEQLPFQSILLEIGETMELNSSNLSQIQPKVKEKVDSYVIDELLGADLSWFWLLVIGNIGVMFLSWWLLTNF